MTKMIELYAFVHSIENGVVTLSPGDSDVRRERISILDVNIVPDRTIARRALIQIPEYLAIGKGLKKAEEEIVQLSDEDQQLLDELVKEESSRVVRMQPIRRPAHRQQNILLAHSVKSAFEKFKEEIESLDENIQI